MGSFSWNEEFSVGVHCLDTDHDLLFGLINQLESAFDGSPEDHHNICSILNAIVDYTDYHFAREETLMAACAFPHLQEHLHSHDTIRRELSVHAARVREGLEKIDPQQLFLFLSQAFLDHLKDEDKKYQPFMVPQMETVLQANEAFVRRQSHVDITLIEND
ncbi:hypothetical protein JCM17960_27500 [Magnetospira thiophila]